MINSKNIVKQRICVYFSLVILIFLIYQGVQGEERNAGFFINYSTQATSDWVKMNPAIAPPARYYLGGQMAYDSESDRVIIFSGAVQSGVGWFISINDTWAYDYNSNIWENMTNEQMRDNGRIYGGMAYDSESDRIILFGGADSRYMANSTRVGETWSYDYNTNTWTNLTTANGPPARGCHSMTYDEANDRMIIYGGMHPGIYYENLHFYQDTWAYDYNSNTWTNMSPPVNPGPLIQQGYAYDSESERTVIFGGRNQSHSDDGVNYPAFSSSNTWVYSYSHNNWTKMSPANSPSRRAIVGMAYMTHLDKACFFGGIIPWNDFSDTWTYDYNTDTWTDMNSPSPPSARYFHSFAYDSESKVIILFGGMQYGGGYVDDTWAYTYQANPPSTPLDFQGHFVNDEVKLNWTSPKTDAGSPITGYLIYRGSTDNDLTLYKTIQGKDTLEYNDTDISKGSTYYYTIRAKNTVGESKSSKMVSITISSSPSVTGFPLILISATIICLAIRRKMTRKKNKKWI